MTRLRETESRDVLEIGDSRPGRSSAIFSSQFTSGDWHGRIAEGTLAVAILDRILHNSYEIYIDGDKSMRKRKGVAWSQ